MICSYLRPRISNTVDVLAPKCFVPRPRNRIKDIVQGIMRIRSDCFYDASDGVDLAGQAPAVDEVSKVSVKE